MNHFIFFFLFILISCQNKTNPIFSLNELNFDQFLSYESIKIILFSKTNISEQILKNLQFVATTFQDLKFGVLNIEENQKISNQFNISKTPLLKIFKEKNSFIDYPFDIEITPLVLYLAKIRYSWFTFLNSNEDIERFLWEFPYVSIFFLNELNTNYLNIIENLSKREDLVTFLFGVIVNASSEIKKIWQIKKTPSILFYRHFDDDLIVHYLENFTEKPILEFLVQNFQPVLEELTENNIKEFIEKEKEPVAIASFDYENKYYLMSSFTQLAKYFKNQIKFAWFDINRFPRLGQFFGFKSQETNFIIVESWVNRKFYPFNSERFEKVEEFITKFLNKKLEYNHRSEPETNLDFKDNILKVAYTTWNKSIIENENNVLVLITSKLHQTCQEFQPIFKQLAKFFEKKNNLIFAQIDISQNDLPDNFHYNFLPSIFLFKKNEKNEPIEFKESKNLEELKKFLLKELKEEKEL
ncbi:protein disulfide isomerase [Anaeramoeba ignava]|uniref:protein disulfide-isomerase n=1 Tax=Anaeramoeba ignava TaxID=1746090 RepID=A0A9Q0LN59_ANAIG|nr:protein disulfide isomerase [Anaeramoeba ignava]